MQKNQTTVYLAPLLETPRGVLPSDQRAEYRTIRGEKLFVQITQAADQQLIGKTLSCIALDASSHGIKFMTEEVIPVGCLLDLWVDDQSRPGKFFLSGDVRWTQSIDSVNSEIGVRLQEGLSTDIDQWREVYAD